MIYSNKINNSKLFILLKYVGIFCLFFISNKAGINGIIYPFIFGVFLAFVWCNQNVALCSVLYVIAGALSNFSIYGLISNILFCFLFLIFYGIHYKIKKPLNCTYILIYACICVLPKIAIDICLQSANIYVVFVEFLIGLLYAFACIKFFECLCVRGISSRLTTLEIICAMVMVGALCLGFSSFEIYEFKIIKLVGLFFILCATYISNFSTSVLLSSAIGIGCLLHNNDISLFFVFMVYCLIANMFKTKNRYITVVSIIAVELFLGFYLKIYPEVNVLCVLPVLLAALAYILIPQKILDYFGNSFQTNLGSLTQQSVINRNRELLFYRLVELSDVFAEMNKVFRSMISSGIVGSDAKRLLLNEVRIKTCKDCPSQGKCYRVCNEETVNALKTMVDLGFEKGKVNILDVPTLFAGKCERLNMLVCTINDLISQYKNYAGLINNIDASKVLLAEQLLGVSNIMKDLSLEVNKGVVFEKGQEKKIIDELTYNNIVCSDALVFEDGGDILSVNLVVRREDALKGAITKIVGKVCGHKMDVYDDVSSSRAGWQVLTLKSAPKYDVIFGIATKTKTGSVKSGDSFSVIKIKDGKYLFAICDGMGSGERAEKTSSTALGLLENFFKAGFDREIIISSVNKLLSLGKEDVFSALDLCVIDTRTGMGNFIKMGAPESFIKHRDTTDTISLSTLPLGIIQNVEARSVDAYFSSGDKIIMFRSRIVAMSFCEPRS